MRSFLLAVAAMFAAALLPHAFAQAPAPAAVTTVLSIRGDFERELTLSLDELKRFPAQHVEDVRIVRDAKGAATAPETARHYTGCLLRDILDQAKPIEKHRFDLRKSVVIAIASDGYRAVFSWAELYLSPIGDGALVVYERDGLPLPESEGPLALVSLKDTRPGPRHVKWLRSIELRTLAN
jgi:DMSO/TMAO reductase YedYZ molybdopterin-dependent catalytic subunit